MLRNWVWNLNPNPVAKTDEVNEAFIRKCAKEKLKKKWMEEVKSENWQRLLVATASSNEVEWQRLGRWLFFVASSLEISQPSSTITGAQE